MPPEVWQEVIDRDRGCVAHRNDFALDVPCSGHLVVHHVRLRGPLGPDEAWNLIALCDGHHRHAHDRDRAGAELAGIIVRQGR